MNKECAACGYDGTLRRLPCPGCGEQKWYCSDCNALGRAFNCLDCQMHANFQETKFKCMVCKNPFVAGIARDADLTGVDIVCGECNEILEGTFVGDQPVFYSTYTRVPAEMAAHEFSHSDVTAVFDPKEFQRVGAWEVICECPRNETRWNQEHN